MLTTLDIVNKVYVVLQTEGHTNIHKHTKPQGVRQDQYIVVNSLQADAEELQECNVNVNCHCVDIDSSRRIADDSSINTMASGVIGDLNNYYDTDIDVTMVFQSGLIQEPDVPEHFINLRFIVRHVNN